MSRGGVSHFQFRNEPESRALIRACQATEPTGRKGVRHGPRSGRSDHASIAHRSGEPPRRRPRRGSGRGLATRWRPGLVRRQQQSAAEDAHVCGRVRRRRYRCAHGATAQPARRGCTANRRDARGNLRILAGARPASCRVRHAAGRSVRAARPPGRDWQVAATRSSAGPRQAAGLMERNSRSRAWLRARAASLSLWAVAAASSWSKVVPGFRQSAASGSDLSFS